MATICVTLTEQYGHQFLNALLPGLMMKHRRCSDSSAKFVKGSLVFVVLQMICGFEVGDESSATAAPAANC